MKMKRQMSLDFGLAGDNDNMRCELVLSVSPTQKLKYQEEFSWQNLTVQSEFLKS